MDWMLLSKCIENVLAGGFLCVALSLCKKQVALTTSMGCFLGLGSESIADTPHFKDFIFITDHRYATNCVTFNTQKLTQLTE